MKKYLLFLFYVPAFLLAHTFTPIFESYTLTPPPSGPGGVGTTDGTSNLKLWLKADEGITLDMNDRVSNWADQSGNGFDVDQSGQNKRPLFQPTGLNGEPSLFFNGEGAGSNTNLLNNTSDNLMTAGSARTTFIVGRMSKCPSVGGTLLASRRSSSVHRSMFYLSPDDGLLYVYSDGNTPLNDAFVPLGLLQAGEQSFLYTQISNGTGLKIEQRLNGASQTVFQTTGNVSSEAGSNGFTIGLSEDDTQSAWIGQISEIIVYDRVLTAQEITDVEAYLSAKYPSSSTSITDSSIIPVTQSGSGYALDFNGTTDRIVMGDELDMGSSNFSLEAWIFTEPGSFTTSLPDLGKRIISKGVSNTGAGYNIQLYHNGIENAALFFISDGLESLGIEATGFEDNKWYHIVGVREGNTISIYVNGMLKGSNSIANTLDVDTNKYFSLGCLTRLPGSGMDPDYGEHFKGILDEVRIWRTALSLTEIRDNMCSKITEKHSKICDLAAYYRLDNGSGSVVSDLIRKTEATISGANWGLSSAPIGDASTSTYNGNISGVFLSNPNNINENLSASLSGGTADGIHAYYVDGVPNSTTGATGFGSNDRYFGVHVINGNSAQYDVIYDYTGNPYVNTDNESTLILLRRDNNADASWENAGANLDIFANWLISLGESTEYTLGSSGVILPVELFNLQAQAIDKNTIRISWQTMTEFNNKGFELQRSLDGKDFSTIAWINGQTNSHSIQSYQKDDKNIEQGVRYLYRLKQVDIDHSSEYSDIVSAMVEGHDFKGIIFPNPAKGTLQIYFSNSDLHQNTALNIYDYSGQLLFKEQYIELPERLVQPIDFLAQGLYFLSISNSKGEILWSEKIVISP